MNILDPILSRSPKVIENGKVYNYLEASPSAAFYEELFAETAVNIPKPELFDQLKSAHHEKGTAYQIMDEIVTYLQKSIPENAMVIEIGGGIYQDRSANAYNRFTNYFPLDISRSSIGRYCEKFQKTGFLSDAKALPFKDNSIDCIFTHTFLEHPLEPEDVLEEIVRVLKPGGIIIHNDAWFCRWWQRFGIVGLKKFSNMSLREKAIYLAAKTTEIPLLRIPPIVFKRIFRAFFVRTDKPVALHYQKLKPNYDLHLGCDEDAANAIDPVDVIRFYESRNFELARPLSFTQRLFHPNRYIVLKKR